MSTHRRGGPVRLSASQESTESFSGRFPKSSGAPGEHGGDELAPAAHAELVERRGQVLLDGVGRDVQLLDDLPGGVPPDDQRDDPGLRAGEPVRAEQQRAKLRCGSGLTDDRSAPTRRLAGSRPQETTARPLRSGRLRQLRRSLPLAEPATRAAGVEGSSLLRASRPLVSAATAPPPGAHAGRVWSRRDVPARRDPTSAAPRHPSDLAAGPPAVRGVRRIVTSRSSNRAPRPRGAGRSAQHCPPRRVPCLTPRPTGSSPVAGTVRPLAAGGRSASCSMAFDQRGRTVDDRATVLVIRTASGPSGSVV